MRLHAAFLLTALALPLAASAHLAGGADATVGGRVLDFGFDPELPVAGAPLTLGFNVADAATGKAVAPDAVWVRIATNDVVAFAGTLTPSNGNVTFSTLAPAAGDYEVKAQYLFGEEKAEGTFPLTVVAAPVTPLPPPQAPSPLPYAAAAAVGLCVGVALRRRAAQPSSVHH